MSRSVRGRWCCLVVVGALGCGDNMDMGSAAPKVTFTKDIHPILQTNCGKSMCHDMANSFIPGHGVADVDVAYAEATKTGSQGMPVYEVILVRTASMDPMFVMPPNYASPPCNGGLGTPGCLTQAQYDLIKAWVDQGHPK